MQQQIQQMANLQKQAQQAQPQQIQANVQQNTQELEKLRKDLQTSNTERDRFQAQLEMLVQELEKRQVDMKFNRSSLILYHFLLYDFIFFNKFCFMIRFGLFLIFYLKNLLILVMLMLK